jgi:hypothetical protein
MNDVTITDTELHLLAVEHAMRISGDELSVLCLAEAAPRSRHLLVTLGRLISSGATPLTEGSPLVLWATGTGELHGGWRSELATHPESLWDRLMFLETIWYGAPGAEPVDGETAFDRMMRLDEMIEQES